jgi:ribose transport system permease protein/erythritol transport system permease protein
MTLPAVAVAVFGRGAVSGGIGRLGGVALAASLVTRLNVGILLFENAQAGNLRLFALSALLLFAALRNIFIADSRSE